MGNATNIRRGDGESRFEPITQPKLGVLLQFLTAWLVLEKRVSPLYAPSIFAYPNCDDLQLITIFSRHTYRPRVFDSLRSAERFAALATCEMLS